MLQLLFLLLNALLSVRAVEWHALQYYTQDDQKYVSLSGEMVVPPIHQAATYYLWPALQDKAGTGVFQPVLDGRSGGWWIGWGWCCGNPDLAWGSGFGVSEGDVVLFKATHDARNGNWNTKLSVPAKNLTATGSFPLGNKVFNEAVFAIELYDVGWDFGPLTFKNINMQAWGSHDLSFCTSPPYNLYGSTNYTQITPVGTVTKTGANCHISRLTLENAQ